MVEKDNFQPLDVEKLRYNLTGSFTENQLKELWSNKVAVMSKKVEFFDGKLDQKKSLGEKI